MDSHKILVLLVLCDLDRMAIELPRASGKRSEKDSFIEMQEELNAAFAKTQPPKELRRRDPPHWSRKSKWRKPW